MEKCYICGRIEDEMFDTAYGYKICCSCANVSFDECEDCEKLFENKDLVWWENPDNWDELRVCNNCYHKREKHYHHDYKPTPKFLGGDRKQNLHVGIELEIQGRKRDSFVNKIESDSILKDCFYCKDDGSLDEDYGIEIVSHPMNIIVARNNWKKMFDCMASCSMKDISDCGLHFHLDREFLNERILRNIDYAVNNFNDYFSKIGGRRYGNNHEWCRTMNKRINQWGTDTDYSDRYVAVNFQNKNTIELRFCKSTYDFKIFLNRLYHIFALVDYCNKHTFNFFDNMNDIQFERRFETYYNNFVRNI